MPATDNRVGNMPQPYSNLPASPTLTNPDMILPDYDDLSPSLDDHDDHNGLRDQSTLMMWKNAHAAASSTDLQQLFASGPLSGPLSNSLSTQDHHTFPSGPITPTTPIIYGNGTMLSDIGEVTEAESTPGRASPSYGRDIGGCGSRSPSPTPLAQSLRHGFGHHHAITSRESRESLAGTPRRLSPAMTHDDGLGGNGSSGGEKSGDRMVGIKERARQQQSRTMMRRDSIDSNSTITTEDQAGLFADFDDAASVGGDSMFQGDDEESNAESYAPDDTYLARQVPVTSTATASMMSAAATPTNSGFLAVPEFAGSGASVSGGNTSDEGDRRLSGVSLSLRAEEILANAKKRLTTMEGNLNRARGTLYVSSPSLGSLPSDGSTPPHTPVRAATASSRYHDPAPNSPMHTRMASDGSMPFTGVIGINGIGNSVSSNGFPQRSASALGAAGGYRKPTGASHNSYPDQQRLEDIQDSLTGGYHRAGLHRPVDIVMERLDEAGSPPNTAVRREPSADDILDPTARSETQLDSYLSPTFSSYSNGTSGSSDKGLSRSGSVGQMRDIKDQVKDLKGKISSLREQARADSLKRRSMQSLRTPSPFTYSQVDQWYADAQPQQKQGASTPQPSASQEQYREQYREQEQAGTNGRSPWNGELESVDGDGHYAAATRQQQQYGEGSREVVTPPAQMTKGQAAAGSNGSGSRYSGQSQRTTPRQPIATPSGGTPTAGTFASGLRADDDDDLHTENGDFDDAVEDGEARTYQLQTQPSLEDVFVDAIDVDDIYEPGEEDGQGQDGQQFIDYGNDGYESESGESMYHDTLQHPISHEDREDAFDYEHFILHSALGTISQQRLARGRSDSFSSEDSVETTRGPSTASGHGKSRSAYPTKSPSRRTSMISIATVESVDSMESFATATEGRSSRGGRLSRNSRINLMGPHESSFEDLAEDSFEDVEDTNSNYTSNRNSMVGNQDTPPPIPTTGAAAIATAAAATATATTSTVIAAKDRPDSVFLAHAAAASQKAASTSASASASTDSLASSFPSASKRNSTEDLRQTQKPYEARRPASSAAMQSHRPSVSSFESTGTTRSFPLVNRNRVGSLNAIGGTAGYPAYRSASSNNGSNSPGSAGPTPTHGHRATLSASASSLASSALQTPPLSQTQFQHLAQSRSQSQLQSRSSSSAQVSDDDAELRSIHETLMNETASVCEQQQQQNGATQDGPVQTQTLQALLKDDQYLVERLVANLGRCVLGLSESGRASSESRMYRRRIDAARRILEGLDSA